MTGEEGNLRLPCGCALLVCSLVLGGLWFVGMSWSHNFGSSSFQLQEVMVVGGAIVCLIAGVVILISGSGGNDEREVKEPDSKD